MDEELDFSDFDPRKQPPHIQKFLIFCIGFFLFCGVIDSFKVENAGWIFVGIPLYLLLGVAFDLIVLVVLAVFAQPINRKMRSKMDKLYPMRGYCPEMPEILRRMLPAPTDHDQTLCALMLVICGKYDDAESLFPKLPIQQLPLREYAMLITAKLMYFMLNEKWERAAHLFAKEYEILESAYDAQPDFSDAFCPYEDDALEFYLLAAVCWEIAGNPQYAQKMRARARERAALRPAAEAACIQKIMELNRLYATGDPAAEKLEAELECEAASLASPVTPGARQNLNRLIMQAKHFGELYRQGAGVLVL